MEDDPGRSWPSWWPCFWNASSCRGDIWLSGLLNSWPTIPCTTSENQLVTKSQALVSFYGSSCSGEGNYCGVLLKVDGQLVDYNMGASIWKVLILPRTSWKAVSSTISNYFCSRVSCWASQRVLDLQEMKLVLVTLSFNSGDKPKASILTAFINTSGSICACKSLCPPLLELLSWGLNPATFPNTNNFLSLPWNYHMQRICRWRASIHTCSTFDSTGNKKILPDFNSMGNKKIALTHLSSGMR